MVVLVAVLSAGCVAGGSRAAARSVSVVQVTGTTLRRVPDDFLGLSVNDQELGDYLGQPAFAGMISAIHPHGGPFSLRIGGQTADRTVWEGTEPMISTQFASPDPYVVGPAWMDQLASLADQTDSRVILGLGAADHSPDAAAALAAAARQALGSHLAALSIGNEPDLYANGLVGGSRAPAAWLTGYGPRSYAKQFATFAPAVQAAAPGVPLLGPETSNPVAPWSAELVDGHLPVGELTAHTYPMQTCQTPGTFRYPSIAGYRSGGVVRYWRAANARLATLAHRHGIPYRVTEMGSASCGGMIGVTDTEATALWAVNQLFSFAAAGINGVNVHLRASLISSALQAPGAGLYARPMFYGMALFGRAVGPDSRLVRDVYPASSHLHVWTVRSRTKLRTVIVNTGRRPRRIALVARAHGTAAVQTLTGSSPRSVRASLDGQTLALAGTWHGPRRVPTVARRHGAWTVTVPADSAQLVTLSHTGPRTRSQHRPR
jgi:hypothetical protein